MVLTLSELLKRYYSLGNIDLALRDRKITHMGGNKYWADKHILKSQRKEDVMYPNGYA